MAYKWRGTPEMAERGGDQTASGSTPTVFISYASQDVAVANAVVEALECRGTKCWIAPRDVVPGEFYAGAIVHAIDAAKVIVLVLSENASTSQHVLREVERASSKRHPVVAFRIDLTPMPADLEYFLNTSHWLDASRIALDQALPKLVDATQRAMAAAAVATPGDTGVAPKPVSNLTRQPPIGRPAGHGLNRPVLALSVLIALGLGYFAADKLWFSNRTASERPIATVVPAATPAAPVVSERSVAVLPFVDMSEKHDQEYFSDGLSEELIDMLTKLPDLRVPARTSSFYFKGKQTKVSEIARELGVAHVLEGSVRKSGDRLRITAQLIRVDNGYHLWSQTFDRKIGDIFQIQDDISNAVVSALKASLSGLAQAHSRGDTLSADAYDLYLLAQSSYDRAKSKEDFQKVVDELRNAIRIDPTFARAWAMLSRTLSSLAGFAMIEPTRGFEDARIAALKAIELSPDGSDGHRALAKILYLHDWNWERAEFESQRALAAGPDDPRNLMTAGIVADILGRGDEALQYAKRAVNEDPLSSSYFNMLGYYLMSAGKLTEAQAAYRRAQELQSSYIEAHWGLGRALLLDGKTLDALAEFERETDEEDRLPGRALAYYALGRSVDADAALDRIKSIIAHGEQGAIVIAEIYAYRGERDQAFAWLARSCQQREPDCTGVKSNPLLKNLRLDPRYTALLHKLNLPE
jgi:TolB-like protein/Tfp pilus assembly protein PilF